jgi:Zn-dependent membrane protease YugP
MSGLPGPKMARTRRLSQHRHTSPAMAAVSVAVREVGHANFYGSRYFTGCSPLMHLFMELKSLASLKRICSFVEVDRLQVKVHISILFFSF